MDGRLSLSLYLSLSPFLCAYIYIYGFGGITVPPVNGSEAVAFVSMPLKSIRVVADLAFLHNEQIMHCQMF